MPMTDKDFMIKAYEEARKSPDPSTQNGALVVVNESFYVGACNTFPIGVMNTPERLVRPLKYNFIEHAERNVLHTAMRAGIRTLGLTMYVPWFACADCGRAIIGAGIYRVVGHKRMLDETPDHWKESITHAMTMLTEAGVKLDYITEKLDIEPILFNGKLWTP